MNNTINNANSLSEPRTPYGLNKNRLGWLEQRILAYAQFKRLSVLRSGDVRKVLAVSALQEKKLLSRLARAGFIVRLKRGCYLFPSRLPLGGVWNPGEYVVLRELMKVYNNGSYQLCGWQTFNRYGFSEQVATRIYVYNNRFYGDRTIAGQEYTFIKVNVDRLGGTEIIMSPDGAEIVMPTKARALVDAVYDWSRFGTLPLAYAWIRQAVVAERGLADDISESACKFGNQGTMRRIGFVLGSLGLRGAWKQRLRTSLRKSASLIPFVPGRPMRGKINREWGVIANE